MLFDRFATLIEYPRAPLADICAALIDDEMNQYPRATVHVAAFAAAVTILPLADLQELYTRTFDFDAETALYIGHHLFGEEGRRGLLIAGLVERYRRLGLDIGAELADHFSPVLRSLALDRDSEEADELVRLGLGPAIAAVLPNVERRAASYAALLRAITVVLEEQTGDAFDHESNRWRLSSSPYFLTLRS